MQPIRTYDLAAIARGSNDVLSREEAAELQAQCIDCGRWISQDQFCCSCGSLVSWKNSKTFKQKYLVLGPGMPTLCQEFLRATSSRRFQSGSEVHRCFEAMSKLSRGEAVRIIQQAKSNLADRGQLKGRALIRYALNALELAVSKKPSSSLLDGDEVYRG